MDTVVVTNHAKTDHGQDLRVTLDAVAVQALHDWRAQWDRERQAWGDSLEDEGWVSPTTTAAHCTRSRSGTSFGSSWIRLVPHLTFDCLRHEHASLPLSAGARSPRCRSDSGTRAPIPSDLYGHLLDDADRHTADAVESVLGAAVATAPSSHTDEPQRQRKGLTSQLEKLF